MYGSTFSLAIFVTLAIIVLYSSQKQISLSMNFNLIIWVIVPIVTYFAGLALSIMGQQISCNNIDIASAFATSWPILVFVYCALIVSLLSYVRAPVTSLFVQIPNVTVLDAEKATPAYKGLAVGFWVFWAVVFGQIFASGMSQVCV